MAVYFVAVAVALVDDFRAVDAGNLAAGFEPRRQGAEAHGAAEVGVDVALFGFAAFVHPFGDECDHRVGDFVIPFGAARTGKAEDVPRVFDDGDLHPQANAEVGDAVFARVLHREDFAFNAAVAEAAGNDDAIDVGKQACALLREVFRIDVADVHFVAAADARMVERFVERFVGIGQIHIFADHGDGDFLFEIGDGGFNLLPHGQVGGVRFQVEVAHYRLIHALFVIEQRDFVNVFHVQPGEDRIGGDVGKEGNLAPLVFGNVAVGAANQHIRLNPDGAQFLDTVLRRLGFQLAGGGDIRQERQVHIHAAAAPQLRAQLADGFQKRQRFDIANRAADFHHRNIRAFRRAQHIGLDGIGDVRNHLHRRAEIIAAPLLADDLRINAPGGAVIELRRAHIDEALVVAKIQVGFRAVVGNEHLAVLERAHRPRIDVDIRIELD